MADVFISYSRKDSDFVRKLYDALTARQRTVWVDWNAIPPAAPFPREIETNIEAAQNFVFVLSPDSVASPWCGRELAHAVLHHKRLIPVLYREVNEKEVAPELRELNWIKFQADRNSSARSPN